MEFEGITATLFSKAIPPLTTSFELSFKNICNKNPTSQIYHIYLRANKCKPTLKSKQIYTEQSLVEALQKGNREAFDLLYNRYSDALYGIVFQIVKSEYLAEDVMQEAFVKIWKNVNHYNPAKGRLFTWLLNIARNTAIDALRSKAGQYANQTQTLSDVTMQLSAPQNELSEQQQLVQEGIKNLSQEHKILIEMAYYQGYTQDEIAKQLQIPLGTIKTRLRVAILQLRKLFGLA